MTRRDVIKMAPLTIVPPLSKLEVEKTNFFPKETMEGLIEHLYLESKDRKSEQFEIKIMDESLEGIFYDPSLHRQRRVGAYWWWEQNGVECGVSIDFLLTEMKEKFSNFSHSKFEEAVNKVHNKYCKAYRVLTVSNGARYYDNV